ncbi:hypothetical protein E8E13_003001 [Curvularia kusanoi]|uniref:Uncharacterized protein n=1 Tax=Curvularia kusanoi TaxID=90978 RepID=A0A9P4WA15_CURKU|nr:hypothetical protein E8E13_003001 [Curvularia kusanoi]
MAAPDPRLHLLALPRELRDHIYGFLTHDLVLKDDGMFFMRTAGKIFKKQPQGPNVRFPGRILGIALTDVIHTTITVENAPCMDVMLVNSQIHQEYRDFCIPKLSASICCSCIAQLIERVTAMKSLPQDGSTSAALALVKTVTLWLYGDLHKDLQKEIKPFLDALAGAMPSLQTLRLIIFDDGEDADSPPHDMSLSNLLPLLHDLFPLMTRKQNVVGQKSWSDADTAEFRALLYSSRQRPNRLWIPESVASYWSPMEEVCARRFSLPLSVLGQADSMHGFKIRINKWVDERCSD